MTRQCHYGRRAALSLSLMLAGGIAVDFLIAGAWRLPWTLLP